MKTKISLGVASLALAVLLAGAASKSAAPAAGSGEVAKVVFENDKVRTIEYWTKSGGNVCGVGMHSHPAHLYIMLTPGKLRTTTPDGKTVIEDAKVGDVGWEPAVTHRVECISGENVHVYLVEVKDKDWKPSDGLIN